ncbi:UPF0172-domain-containing protein [Peniophora sp. CONT]|nr:UPF0172-domain-containing protein [Peniophora sp. CONT]
MPSYNLSDLAYAKMLVHALKHPHARVNGVLLGSSGKGKEVTISDAVPLLHHWTSLSPMMEIGLDITRNHAADRGLSIVGYYQAMEYVDANAASLGPVGERVVEKIKDGFADALAIVIDGAKLGSVDDTALVPYVHSAAGYRPTSTSMVQLSDSTPTRVLELVRTTSLHEKFGDFDDHLEDLSVDWLRNATVHEALSAK